MYNSTKKAHIHFVGIGGIGMSGIATILHAQGYSISGCDQDLDQSSIKNLQKRGCTIFSGNNTAYCRQESVDILVYSSALKPDNPEIMWAKQRGIPTIERALMLAELMRTKYSIAIAGAHGKTTTTSLISHILMEAHLDPTVIIGGHLKTISHNARMGLGNFLVAEADESDRSFLNLYPTLAVVTNIDLEHLETYKDINDIKNTFARFLANIPFYGKAIVCIDDPHIRSILPIDHIKAIHYGLTADADVYATDIILHPDHSEFIAHKKNSPTPLGMVFLAMPGIHNVQNALGAIALALELDIEFETIALALQSFKGVDRRFTYRGSMKGIDIFDDYGHHPNEILHTLKVARKRTKNRLTVVFQPHRFTRTYHLWDHFLEVLNTTDIDHLIITDIFPASETPIEGITSARLVEALKERNGTLSVSYIPYEADFQQIIAHLTPHLQADDLLLLLGAGKVNKMVEKLLPLV
jgi:UDP-N-acetylmuramate--alanine ligase